MISRFSILHNGTVGDSCFLAKIIADLVAHSVMFAVLKRYTVADYIVLILSVLDTEDDRLVRARDATCLFFYHFSQRGQTFVSCRPRVNMDLRLILRWLYLYPRYDYRNPKKSPIVDILPSPIAFPKPPAS